MSESASNSLRADANLTGVAVPGGQNGLTRLLQVGVGHDDQRGVAAQFHGDLFQSGRLADVLPHVPAAGEGDLADPPIGAQGPAYVSPHYR